MASIKSRIDEILDRNKLTIDDLNSLSDLFKSGLSIKNALILIKSRNNEKLFNEIIKRLDKGESADKVLVNFLPKNIGYYCLPLLKTMTLEDSLSLSLAFHKKTNENIKDIESKLLYPFILVFVSLSALYLFDMYGFDSILSLLRSFNTDSNSLMIIRIILRVIVYLFYFGLLIAICLVKYFSSEKNITLLYLFLSKYFKDNLLQIYFCEEFISLFKICMDQGCKSKESLKVLKSLKHKPIISFLAFHLDEKLLDGDSLKNASEQVYYDSTLNRFIAIGMYTNDFLSILDKYVLISKNKIKNKLKKITITIQLTSYICIGSIIVFIYQVLFIPMKALSSF